MLTHWGPHVGEVMGHISGNKADFPNQGCVRSDTRVAAGPPNSDICAAKAIADLVSNYPGKFTNGVESIFADWLGVDTSRPSHMTAILRSDVAKNGARPAPYSTHSPRAGGETALYRDSKDIALVARFGRWGGEIYLGPSLGKPSNDGRVDR